MINILVVEDEAPIREWVVYTIKNSSPEFNVIGNVSNGKDALEIINEKVIDLLITDIKMPIMDGIELSKKAKAINPDLYIVILTNFAEFNYAKEAISFGVYEYLIKSDIRPKEIKEMLEVINTKVNSIEKSVLKIERNKSKYSKSIEKALTYIECNYKNHISLIDISKHVYLSHEYFSRLFKEEVGENFSAYLNIFRITKGRELLRNTDMKISQVAYEVGYSNAGYFSKNYKKYLGVSPEDDR